MTWIGTILLTLDRSQIYTRSQRYSKDCSYPDSRRMWKAPRTSTDSSRLTGGDSRPRPPSSGCSMMFADEKCRSMVVLLDLSAAFDTIDIETLLRRLEHTFGITGSALLWLRTYLEGRSQYVRIGDNQSTILPCEFGVPQGSVLGPKLFAAYIAPIAGVISSFGIHHAQYADDTQLYIELRDDNTLLTLSSCFRAVHGWFSENGLALNPDKSEVIVIGTGARNRREGEIGMTTLGDTQITVSKTVKSLGVTLDDKLSFNTHVDNVCKAAHFHIRALRHIRGCIDEETACMVASSMVGSRLDYCNSVLHGTSAENLGKLQRVLHALARVVSGTRRSDHITPVLARLHWLPVAARITFKIALLTFKAITTKKPEYLAEMLDFQATSRTLRSSSRNRLHVKVVRTVFASHAFRHAAPSIWNNLPTHLTDLSLTQESFKKQLKTHLYNKSYRH